jgi:hypothetical protein
MTCLAAVHVVLPPCRYPANELFTCACPDSRIERMSTPDERVQDDSDVLSADHLAAWVDNLALVDINAPDAALIDQISQLERLKCACAAAQASLTVAFVTSQTAGLSAAEAREGIPRPWEPARRPRQSPHPGNAAHLRRTPSRPAQ